VDVIDNVDLASALNAFNGARAATLPRDNDVIEAKSLFAAKLPSDVALILSNEGRGLSPSLSHAVTDGLTIPMANAIESLNVASAGAIALFHIAKSMGRILS
jgi:RNA methyltransferase, TrmH family